MYISERLVYFEMHKTGCTKIRRLLKEIDGGELIGKHNRPETRSQFENRLLLSSIRNPWAWYVSFWAFGCGGEGGVAQRLTRKNAKHSRFWQELYSDPMSRDNFAKWLIALMDNRPNQIKGFFAKEKLLRTNIGLMTFRFLGFSIENSTWQNELPYIENQAELLDFYNQNNILNGVIRTEHLISDLQNYLSQVGVDTTENALKPHKMVNASAHKEYAYYYTPELIDLVAARDAIIIERFGYSFDG